MESLPEKVKRAGELYLSGLSTRDLAPLLGVSKSTAALYVAKAGVKSDKISRISAKAKGRPSTRKGATHTEQSKAKMSAARKGKTPTLGTRRTPEQKLNMKTAAQKRWDDADEKARMLGLLSAARFKFRLSKEEKAAREKTRNACKRFLRRVLVMARVRKELPTETLLGYTKAQLRQHLEMQFKEGMSWAERESFHIDHIKPCAAFFSEGIYDPSVINALTNLQVLTPDENRRKSDTYIPGIVEA